MSKPFVLFQDRVAGWCAVPPGFRDILRDPIGRGSTRREALDDLLAHPDFVHRARLGEWLLEPNLADFVVRNFSRAYLTPDGRIDTNAWDWDTAARRLSFKVVWNRDGISHDS